MYELQNKRGPSPIIGMGNIFSKKGLTTANFVAFALHLTVGIAMSTWYFSVKGKNPDAIPTALFDVVPCGERGVETCLKAVTGHNADFLISLMLIFIFFTALMHLVYGIFQKWYHKMLDSQNNWMRWVEYAISATILFVVIAMSSGTKDFNVILLFLFGMVGIMILGDAIEKIIKSPLGRSSGAQWPATAGAWIIFVAILVVFGRGYQAAKDNAGSKMPKFVDWVMALTMLFFSSFGFIQALHVGGVFKDYVTVEASYIILSFVAKIILGLTITSGLTVRQETAT
jgi:Heliorhodopsin